MALCISDHSDCAHHKQLPEITITLLRSLPPLEFCRGTSPIHAARLRPDRKDFGSATAATSALARSGPTPGIPISRRPTSVLRALAIIEAVGEALVSIACMAVFLWWARDARGVEKIILLTLSAASVVMLLVTTGFRRAVWRAKGESVAACRDLLRRQAVLGLVFARVGYIGGPLGVLVGVMLGQVGGVGASLEGPIDAVLAVSASVIFVAGWLWALREAG